MVRATIPVAAALLLLAAPAHAVCRAVPDRPDVRLCDVATLEAVRADVVRLELQARIARADADLERDRAAALQRRLEAVVPCPAPRPVWPWVAGGVAAGVVVVLAAVAVAR